MDSERPKFLPSYLDLLRQECEKSGWRALIPTTLIICSAIGAVSAYFIPDAFWSDDKWDISTAVYGGLLAFCGLILTLGWNAFSRMYELLYQGDFGAYLHEHKLLNAYLTHISFVHLIQLVAIAFSGIGLITVLMDILPMLFDRMIFGSAIAFTVYGLIQATDAVTAMNDLAWQASYFERHKNPVQPVQQNVRNIR